MGKIIEFEPWFGELGWEIMTWAPYCRFIAQNYDKAIITSFKGMEPLYKDFAEFKEHDEKNPMSYGRSLTYPKRYRLKEAKYIKYGIPDPQYDILIHARGCRRKDNYNYTKWEDVIQAFKILGLNYKTAFIGTLKDQYVFGCDDRRNIDLQSLMNLISGAKVVIGVSSGVMHLASACGTDLVVWGDSRTYFSETLEQRYKRTWNPFRVNVSYIYANNWQPKPEEIIREVRKCLNSH